MSCVMHMHVGLAVTCIVPSSLSVEVDREWNMHIYSHMKVLVTPNEYFILPVKCSLYYRPYFIICDSNEAIHMYMYVYDTQCTNNHTSDKSAAHVHGSFGRIN